MARSACYIALGSKFESPEPTSTGWAWLNMPVTLEMTGGEGTETESLGLARRQEG